MNFYANICSPTLALEDKNLMIVVAVDILTCLIIYWESNNIRQPTERSSDSSYFYLYENQMSQQVLCDAHFPHWFITLENAVEESRHCLSHFAASSYNIYNTATAEQGFSQVLNASDNAIHLFVIFASLLRNLHFFSLRDLSEFTT